MKIGWDFTSQKFLVKKFQKIKIRNLIPKGPSHCATYIRTTVSVGGGEEVAFSYASDTCVPLFLTYLYLTLCYQIIVKRHAYFFGKKFHLLHPYLIRHFY